MSNSRIALSGILAVLVTAVFGGAVISVHAAHADDCNVTTAQIAQITAIKDDPTLTSSEELIQELALRKQLVSQTITCAETEVTQLQTALQTASTTDATGQAVQSELSDDLDTASSFYDGELQKLSTAGIAGSEAVAADVLSWRQGSFAPLSENVNNFILWSSNQGLFATAAMRMDETHRAVSFLESANPDPALQTAFDQANASFTDAEDENIAARSALAKDLSPNQSLLLVKQSLGSLSDTYKELFSVSTLIKDILP